MNKELLQHLKAEKLLKTKQLRMDTTVVESPIAYPTDAGLLSQGIKTINRSVSKLKEAGVKAAAGFVAHERTIKKTAGNRRTDQTQDGRTNRRH